MADSNGKIALVVDDNKIARRPMQLLLEKRGFGVTEIDNCADAEELVKTKPFDVIVLDIVMPGKDGFTFAKEIRRGEHGETNQETVLVGASGLTLVGRDLSREASGFDLFVKKGMSLNELSDKLDGVLVVS